MQIKAGDYMVWYGSTTKTGHCGFRRQNPSGFSLEPVRFPDGDDKFYAGFIRTSDDFWQLGDIIAQTHNMLIEYVGPDKNANYNAFIIHDAVRFVSRSAPEIRSEIPENDGQEMCARCGKSSAQSGWSNLCGNCGYLYGVPPQQ